MNESMNGVGNVQGTGGMQHSESMHSSHHNQDIQDSVGINKVDSFKKTEKTVQSQLYNEKGQIVK